jgi:hypothetical protein
MAGSLSPLCRRYEGEIRSHDHSLSHNTWCHIQQQHQFYTIMTQQGFYNFASRTKIRHCKTISDIKLLEK